MSLIPHWKAPSGNWGFDETATPRWFMVGHRASKAMLLDFAAGKVVKSVNRHIADVQEDSPEGQSRFFMIKGKSPGRTRIEVRDGRTNALEAVLEVEVKRKQQLKISFHFVEDKKGTRTIQSYSITEDLIEGLNNIYESQTNLTFELGSINDLKLDIGLIDFVIEGRDPKSKEMTGEARLGPKDVWNKVFAAKSDKSADFNVFFVPTDPALTTNETLVFTDWTNCVMEDGRQLPIYTLAHAVGRMLGCPITSNPNKMNQLMFWDPGIGANFFGRSDDFIPRDCVRIMNP